MSPRNRIYISLGALALACAACFVDEDCALNGICVASACVCSQGWVGASCGQLDLLPAPMPSMNGYNVPNTSSWGAGVLFDEPSGVFHM